MSEDKIEQFYRDATADDVARAMNGARVYSRFRNSTEHDWANGELKGCGHRVIGRWLDDVTCWWDYCQVYDPPEWFVNKPEPSEGWRLLEKFPPEAKLGTDEAWQSISEKWYTVINDNGVQQVDCWYRRRIETNSPTSSESSRSREDIPSGWRLLGKDEERLASDAYWSLGAKDWIVIGDDRVAIANELPRWHAIRQVGRLDLIEGFSYTLPSSMVICVSAKGFEVR
jgi:hypothetical protein